MKLFKKGILVLLILSIGVFQSCKSDDAAEDILPSPEPRQIFLRAKVDGASFNSDPLKTLAITSVVDDPIATVLVFGGVDEQGRGIDFIIADFTIDGTYDLGMNLPGPHGNFMGSGGYVENQQTPCITYSANGGVVGKVIVTKYIPNEWIEGTFEFTAFCIHNDSSRSITAGEFAMEVQYHD